MTNTNRMFAEEMRKGAEGEFDRAEHIIKTMLRNLEGIGDTRNKIATVRDAAEQLQRVLITYDKFVVMAEVLEDAADYDEQDDDE